MGKDNEYEKEEEKDREKEVKGRKMIRNEGSQKEDEIGELGKTGKYEHGAAWGHFRHVLPYHTLFQKVRLARHPSTGPNN